MGNLREIGLILKSNSVCAFASKLMSTQELGILNLAQEDAKKNYTVLQTKSRNLSAFRQNIYWIKSNVP